MGEASAQLSQVMNSTLVVLQGTTDMIAKQVNVMRQRRESLGAIRSSAEAHRAETLTRIKKLESNRHTELGSLLEASNTLDEPALQLQEDGERREGISILSLSSSVTWVLRAVVVVLVVLALRDLRPVIANDCTVGARIQQHEASRIRACSKSCLVVWLFESFGPLRPLTYTPTRIS